MAIADHVPAAVQRYLEELEREVKRLPGVSPEEALSDAREFLLADAGALARSGEGPDDTVFYDRIVESFGLPAEVARQYVDHARPVARRPGFAPGWRICCTKCGRSAPLAAVGGIRIGARSRHKYTVGYCRDCRWLRFLRIVQDLDDANLTRQLGVQSTTDEMRRTMHRPWAVLLTILLMTAAVIAVGWFARTGLALGADATSNQAAVERLKRAIEQDYSYRDRLKIDWQKRFQEFEPRWRAANNNTDQFTRTTSDFLCVAQDGHLWLKRGDQTLATHQLNLRPNFNPRVLPQLVPQLKQHGKTVLTGRFPDNIRYVAITTWDHREPESMQAALAAVRDAAQAKAPLILDVRANMGGDEVQARAVAGLFVEKPTIYAKHIRRASGEETLHERVLSPDAAGLRHPGPCLVLMGPANISSCESFLLMMRAAGCPLMGAKSHGSSGNPQPHDLGNGLTVMLPSWRQLSVDEDELEGVGITPDIVVDAKPEEFERADPVLTKSLGQLRAR